MRTAYNGAVEGTYTSLPFGDAQMTTGTDGDQYHYAMLDYDSETGSDHAQFRQYSSIQGRWMRPDPYYGSYDAGNPQSFNRYASVLNNPLSYVDPSGLTQCQMGRDGTIRCTPTGGGDSTDCSDDSVVCVYDDPPDPNDCDENPSVCFGTGGGSGQTGNNGGGGGAAPSSVNQILQCASKTANQFSIAGVLGLTGEGGGIGSTVGTAFLGNTFSGIVDAGTHLYNNATIGGNGNEVVGDWVLGGGRQGLPGGGPFSKGVVGIATEAGVNAITPAGEVLSVTGAAAPLAEEGLAGPVGWAKLGLDLAIFLGSALNCASR